MSKLISLGKNKFTIVDEDNFEWLNQWKWYCNSRGYVQRSQYLGGRRRNPIIKCIKMHRLILGLTKKTEYTDHINGNKLDNRRENLRSGTSSQNQMNRGKQSNNTSGYKGVYFYKDRNAWVSYLYHNRKGIFVGYFKTKIDAALAYNQKAKEIFGEYAKLNQL